MKVSNFFKTLNNKIEKYNKLAVNPFTKPQSIVLVWVEEEKTERDSNDFTK